MRRRSGPWSLSWDIKTPPVGTKVSDLAKEQPRREHVRGCEENVSGRRVGYFVTCSRFRVGGTARHEDENPLTGLLRGSLRACPCRLHATQGCLIDLLEHGITFRLRPSVGEYVGVQCALNLLLEQ